MYYMPLVQFADGWAPSCFWPPELINGQKNLGNYIYLLVPCSSVPYENPKRLVRRMLAFAIMAS